MKRYHPITIIKAQRAQTHHRAQTLASTGSDDNGYQLAIFGSERDPVHPVQAWSTSIAPLNAAMGVALRTPSALPISSTKKYQKQTIAAASTPYDTASICFLGATFHGVRGLTTKTTHRCLLRAGAGWLIFQCSDYSDFPQLVASESTNYAHAHSFDGRCRW
jgi:hypothetical protein